MKSLFYLISTTLLLFTGCSTDKTGIFDLYSQAGKSITMIDYATDPQYRDPVNITDARIHGDRLELTVQFSGGCKEHRFFLYGWRGFSKSKPVQADLFLSHNANDDSCEALLTGNVQFDLTPLKELYWQTYSDNGPILLRIYAPGMDRIFYPLPAYLLQ